MAVNRISQISPLSAVSGVLPAGFALCPFAGGPQAALTLQLIAQQQAYENAILAAREEALRAALNRLQFSIN